MENAGAALAQAVRELAEEAAVRRVLIVAGPGSNGGDGLVAARQLFREDGLEIAVAAPLGLCRQMESPATLAARNATALGIEIHQGGNLADLLRAGPGMIVDALFGLGLDRPLEGTARTLVETMAEAVVPVLAVDVPSGLDADTGAILGAIVPAHWTLSFVAPKAGFFAGEGPAHCGAVAVAGIGVADGYAAAWRALQTR